MRIRLVVMAIGLLGTVSALALIPAAAAGHSRMGSATLVVYLFHGFAVRYAEAAGWQDWSGRHPATSLVVTTLSAIALALVLASPPVRRVLTWAVDPVNTFRRHRQVPEPPVVSRPLSRV